MNNMHYGITMKPICGHEDDLNKFYNSELHEESESPWEHGMTNEISIKKDEYGDTVLEASVYGRGNCLDEALKTLGNMFPSIIFSAHISELDHVNADSRRIITVVYGFDSKSLYHTAWSELPF